MTTLVQPATGRPIPTPPSTRLVVVLAFTAINALCAGLITTGLFFAAHAGYGYGTLGNYGLGLVIGGTYTVGAMLAGRVVAAIRGRTRIVLGGVLAAQFAATLWPIALPGHPVALLLLAASYGPATALLWPIVQSYVGGGRTGPELRRAIGAFNLTWGSALVVGFGSLGPLLETDPEATLAGLGVLHLLSAALLLGFAPTPERARVVVAGTITTNDLELRAVLQGLLPLTNVLAFALTPFLPEAFARLGLPSTGRASFAIAWLLPRALTFGILGHWHGWHGRRATAYVGGAALLTGFALATLAPWLDRGGLGLALEIVGLIAFGIGMATVYTAAFYYAQVTGRAAVGAAGRHEALLGLGATIGPALGLLVAALVGADWLPGAAFEPALAATCVTVALAVGWRALRR